MKPALIALTSALAATAALAQVPAVPSDFGPTAPVSVPLDTNPDRDQFQWLEDVDGAKAMAWVKGQNARSAKRLEGDPRARPHALGDPRRRHRGERAPADRLRRLEDVDRAERDRRELPRAA